MVIPAGQALYPTLASSTLAAKDVTINAGGSLSVSSGATLQVNGDFANNGTATLGGTVSFVGSAATQTLSNSGGFTTIVINKPTGTVQLAQNLTINSALTLTSGTLTTTGAYQVNLGGSAIISESAASYVTGKVVVNRTLSPGTAQSFAGLGLTLTPAAGSTAPGATLVSRTTGTALSGRAGSSSIQRYFDIVPATNTGLDVTMNFSYFDHELNGIPTANLALFKSETGTSGPWVKQSPITKGSNQVTKTGITGFSVWTLGNDAAPLPVTLVSFGAEALSAAAVQLRWTTATETNSASFVVERSLNGQQFTAIGQLAAAGNSNSAHNYALLDGQLPAGALLLYYRLRQLDQDGTATLSGVQVVRLPAAGEPVLRVQPNPAAAGVLVRLTGAEAGQLVQVYTAVGQLVFIGQADASGAAVLRLIQEQPAGVYVVRAGVRVTRLVIE